MGLASEWLERAAQSDTDDCLLFPYKPSARYGSVWRDGRFQYAHVVMLDLVGRPLQPGQETRHTCGVARCCNPRHLRGGTHAENEADKWRHGTQGAHRGESSPTSKLTEADVRAIRASTETHAVLAVHYGVNRRTIGGIRRRTSWRHVT